MAQVVEADFRQPRLLEEWLEAAPVYVRGFERRADLRGEHEPAVLVQGPGLQPRLRLARPVDLQRFHGSGGKADGAPLAALRCDEPAPRSVAHPLELAAYPELGLPVELQVCPPQPQELTAPQTDGDRDDVERLQAVFSRSVEEGSRLLGQQNLDLLVAQPGQIHRLGGVTRHEAPPEGLLEGP